MNPDPLAAAPTGRGPTDAAEVLRPYLIPRVTRLTEDRIGHDLAPDTLEFARGEFRPSSDRVLIDVDAAYAFLGNARAALLMVLGQPDQPGATLYDSGGAPVEGARWFSMASVNGESAWASTTHRRIVVDVEPDKPVTWQLVGAITGGAEVVPVPDPGAIAIRPDGVEAFVASPSEGTITPIVLGRPGYTVLPSRSVNDVALDPIAVGARPGRIAADDDHVVVCLDHGAEGAVAVLSAATHAILRRVQLGASMPTDCAITPTGSEAVVTCSDGRIVRLVLASGEMIERRIGEDARGVAVTAAGDAAYVADAASELVRRVSLPGLEVEATTEVAERPHVVRVAPDGQVWVLSDPRNDLGRLQGIDPSHGGLIADHTLPFPHPSDLAIVPVAEQSSSEVRSAWIAFADSHYCQFLIGGSFAGQPHSFHHGSLGEDGDRPASIAVNDYAEIWMTQPNLDRVWKWPGGRLLCRADDARPYSGVFFGEYCEVAVYGAEADEAEDA